MIAIVDADSCIYQAAWQQDSVKEALSNYKTILNKNWIEPVWADESKRMSDKTKTGIKRLVDRIARLTPTGRAGS